jgi:uncharacterized membrane protein
MNKKERIVMLTMFTIMFLFITLDSGLRLARTFSMIYSDIGLLYTIGLMLLGLIAELVVFVMVTYICVHIGYKVYNKIKES